MQEVKITLKFRPTNHADPYPDGFVIIDLAGHTIVGDPTLYHTLQDIALRGEQIAFPAVGCVGYYKTKRGTIVHAAIRGHLRPGERAPYLSEHKHMYVPGKTHKGPMLLVVSKHAETGRRRAYLVPVASFTVTSTPDMLRDDGRR